MPSGPEGDYEHYRPSEASYRGREPYGRDYGANYGSAQRASRNSEYTIPINQKSTPGADLLVRRAYRFFAGSPVTSPAATLAAAVRAFARLTLARLAPTSVG